MVYKSYDPEQNNKLKLDLIYKKPPSVILCICISKSNVLTVVSGIRKLLNSILPDVSFLVNNN